jgi:flagella basal body P-ring formation protein FlgA
MIALKRALLLASALLLLVGGAAGQASLSLPREAHVAGRQLSLGQVVRIEGPDLQQVERLRAYSLGYTPAPGFSRVLSAERLGQELARAFPGESLRFLGERHTRVWPATETITAAAQREAGAAALTDLQRGRTIEFLPLAEPADLAVPAGAEPARLVARLAGQNLASNAVEVSLEVYTDGALYRTLRLPYRAVEWVELPVLVRDVAPGETLSVQDFKLERLPKQPGQVTPLTLAMAAGALSSRALRAGQPISAQDVHRPLAILAGNTLFVEVRRGSVAARSLGVALDSGSLGDRIRIQLAGSQREMRAVVQSRDLVVVSLDPEPALASQR